MSTSFAIENTSDPLPEVDLAVIASELKLDREIVEKTVRLLDDGNTIPFITRFRRDLTGGLNERQLLELQRIVAQQRALAERRRFILKSLESRDCLSEELNQKIQQANTGRELEDLYLPFKARKQSRAALAKQQGLEPLAEDILNATNDDIDIASRATHFVRVDRGLNSVDEVIRGVCDLLVDRYSENVELRNKLRSILKQTGKIEASAIAEESQSTDEVKPQTPILETPTADPDGTVAQAVPTDSEPQAEPVSIAPEGTDSDSVDSSQHTAINTENTAALNSAAVETTPAGSPDVNSVPAIPSDDGPVESDQANAIEPVVETPEKIKKKSKKKKKKEAPDPFAEYHGFSRSIKQVLPHQILALNRGERAGKVRVRISSDEEKLQQTVIAASVPEQHPFREFLVKCALESLNRSVLPSIEREIRRELTEIAERHAIEVFANNLRNLLLQPPLRNRRVLAIDPGFKSGCTIAILDEYGNLLDSGQVYVIGNQSRRQQSMQRMVDWVRQYKLDTIAIGTGAACRQAEQLVSDTIAEHFADQQVHYVMVNEAGASYYSTSEIGREELPDVTPAIRSAISIGRRLQDPLSELVKISPANMGIGMYQHDVKAKHLGESLNQVVELCVNQVGVNVNTASPALLKYVSGLNSLTARRLVEHRQKISGFRNRQQLKEVAGIGEATFVQAAGFLRIHGGDNPLDATAIHPESYSLAEKIIAKVNSSPGELFPVNTQELPTAAASACSDLTAVAAENTIDVQVQTSIDESAESVTIDPINRDQPKEGQPENVQDQNIHGESCPAENIPDTQVCSQDPLPANEDTAVEKPIEPTPNLDTNQTTETVSVDSSADGTARREAIDRLSKLKISQLLEEIPAGRHLVRDLLQTLRKPYWDPRERTPRPIFRRGILKIDDLKPEMQLDGQVVNVVDFGVFVDIGLGESSLIHVSQLGHHYITDPHRHYSIGDILKVWVTEIDSQRRRARLTAIKPGSQPPNRSRKPSRDSKNENRRQRSDSRNSRSKHQSSEPKERTSSRVDRFDKGKSGKGTNHRSRVSSKGAGSHSRGKPRKPPAAPITEEMLKGDEPMRSFSDLLQFVQKKPNQQDSDS